MTELFSSTGLLTGTTAAVVLLASLGIGVAARRAGMHHPTRWGVVVATITIGWLATTTALAFRGVLSNWSDRPPRWQLLPPIVLGVFVPLSRTRSFRKLLVALPLWQPIALQTFRVGVEFAFWQLHAEGCAPVQVTFEGRNLDVVVGLSAPIVAAAVAFGWIGTRVVILWNLLGLAILINTIATVSTSAPGPLHIDWSGEPFTAIAAWPIVWIPSFLAPVAVLLHVTSVRQALSRIKSSTKNNYV